MGFSFEQLALDPKWFLHTIDFDQGQAVFRKIGPALANRHCGKAKRRPGRVVRLSELLADFEGWNGAASSPVHFIWMTDFCGSTLYANALNAMPGLFLYNETRLFSDLAFARRRIDSGRSDMSLDQWRTMLKMALFFQGKTFEAGDVALVKEWPSSNVILPDMLAVDTRSRGVFLYATLENYLTACLKLPRRRELARARIEKFTEIRSINALKDLDLKGLSDAQAAAVHWLHLMYLHAENNLQDHPRLRTLFNEDLFNETERVLSQSAKHFSLDLKPAEIRDIARGPIFNSHSKKASQAFSAEQRDAAYRAARDEFNDEVSEALAWARTIMDSHHIPDHPGTNLLHNIS